MVQAEIAVLRFGLGARPGDLAAAAGDPRAWLTAQIKDKSITHRSHGHRYRGQYEEEVAKMVAADAEGEGD